jgi:hypothetical protein
LVKVEGCNALLHLLLVCFSFYLKSVLRYEFLILDTYHSDVCIYVGKDVGIRGYFSKPKGAREQKGLGNTGLSFSLRPFTAVLGLNQGQFGWEWSKCYWDRFFSSTSVYFCQCHFPNTPHSHSLMNALIHHRCGVRMLPVDSVVK